jgi:hypothetical protein
MDWQEHRGMLNVLSDAAEALRGIERREPGAELPDPALLIAIILEAIQQMNWTTPDLDPISVKEAASFLHQQAKRLAYELAPEGVPQQGSKLVN